VQVSAGAHAVKTNPNPNGIFQQPLHITVEQGTEQVVVDLLTTGNVLLATTRIDVSQIHNEESLQPEVTYQMQQKSKGIHNPTIKLTMIVSGGDDEEKGLLEGGLAGTGESSVGILVRQQLKKAKHKQGEEGASEMDVLKEACTGPLELFEGLGQTQKVFVAIVRPPMSKGLAMGIWKDQRDFADRKSPVQEIALLKILSIQADPQRNHVFVVNCYDQSRVRQSLMFRRVDRNRDVWVEILHLLVMKARAQEETNKDMRKTSQEAGRVRASSHASSSSGKSPKSPRPHTYH